MATHSKFTHYTNVDGDTVTIEKANLESMRSWRNGFRSGLTLSALLLVAACVAVLVLS